MLVFPAVVLDEVGAWSMSNSTRATTIAASPLGDTPTPTARTSPTSSATEDETDKLLADRLVILDRTDSD
ncbi:hypothetical protein EP51_41340 (plasmid) [Rhodococcus opacus]|uniref:Uncharacterized protein n=1 Tax=Rhodococcus opacus TaxID=37919 RepID=A0A076EZ24_RHOOP|nr:hypothetical protein EP51_41340 [Rhodococcus opacus]